MSTAKEIADWLHDQGHGDFAGTASWDLYVGTEPDLPANVVTIYDTGGGAPETDELDVLNPTIQVRVRGISYPDAYARQELIRSALIHAGEFENEDGGVRYVSIDMTSDILSIGRDESDRFLLTANYRVIKEEI